MRRLAESRDLAQVFALYMQPTVIPYLGYDAMPLSDFQPLFSAWCRSGDFYVYERDGRIAGFYRATRYPGRAAHVVGLGMLAVAPDCHGQGVAAAMVGEAIAALREQGLRRVELSVESDNPRAIRFYQRLGFEIEGTLRQFYKRAGADDYIDEYVMGLLLR